MLLRSVGWQYGGAMDLERVRVKLEVARARMSGPFSEIPTGREYDSPPDAADELAYDALEKAYNSAFSVPTPARATTSPRTHDADLPFRHDAQPRYVLVWWGLIEGR
ncbi:hypothetical protein BBJ28_00006299 [Nothophytophthora sp. Chile5]|nr:hypothetical protein BBJ28_00006299 [Nothophytophthora sp. Chile5]